MKKPSILCEPDGKVSASRAIAVILTFSFLPVFLYYAFWKGQVVDIPTNMAWLTAALYGVNRLTNWVSNGRIKTGKAGTDDVR